MDVTEMSDLGFALMFHLLSIVLAASEIFTSRIMNIIHNNYKHIPFFPMNVKTNAA